MEDTITMSSREQRRAWVLSRVEAGEMGVPEAARLLGLSERSIRRLRIRFAREGPAGPATSIRTRRRRMLRSVRPSSLAASDTPISPASTRESTQARRCSLLDIVIVSSIHTGWTKSLTSWPGQSH